ncbi:MAG: hypothetical protein PHR45_05685 [Muribaculaceae bacterium]|nr:hypothetical protein [Muribaculaceae bacterium]
MAKQFFKRYWLMLVGVVVGAIGGYLYWSLVGCASGTCPITASPINSTIVGAILGGLLFDTFKNKKKNE